MHFSCLAAQCALRKFYEGGQSINYDLDEKKILKKKMQYLSIKCMVSIILFKVIACWSISIIQWLHLAV